MEFNRNVIIAIVALLIVVILLFMYFRQKPTAATVYVVTDQSAQINNQPTATIPDTTVPDTTIIGTMDSQVTPSPAFVTTVGSEPATPISQIVPESIYTPAPVSVTPVSTSTPTPEPAPTPVPVVVYTSPTTTPTTTTTTPTPTPTTMTTTTTPTTTTPTTMTTTTTPTTTTPTTPTTTTTTPTTTTTTTTTSPQIIGAVVTDTGVVYTYAPAPTPAPTPAPVTSSQTEYVVRNPAANLLGNVMTSSTCTYTNFPGILVTNSTGAKMTPSATSGGQSTCQKSATCRAWDTAGNSYDTIDYGTYYPTRPYVLNVKSPVGCNTSGVSKSVPTPTCGWFKYPNSSLTTGILGHSSTPKAVCGADLDCSGYNETTGDIYGYSAGKPVVGSQVIYMKNFKLCKP